MNHFGHLPKRSMHRRIRSAILGFAAAAAAVQSARTQRVRWHIAWAAGAGASHDGLLHARSLGDGTAGVLLLHGLGGSNAYWGAAYDTLARAGRLIVPDLLGFGASPRPSSGYTATDHVEALTSLLDELAVTGPIVVGAHSFGCLVALALAEQRPDLVVGVVAFCPPLYPDEVMRRDGVQHSWASYSQSFRQVLASAEGGRLLTDIHVPVELVAGADDPVTDLAYLRQLAEQLPHVALAALDRADHDLPLTNPTGAVVVLTRAANVLSCFRAAGDPYPSSVADTDDDTSRPGHDGGHEL